MTNPFLNYRREELREKANTDHQYQTPFEKAKIVQCRGCNKKLTRGLDIDILCDAILIKFTSNLLSAQQDIIILPFLEANKNQNKMDFINFISPVLQLLAGVYFFSMGKKLNSSTRKETPEETSKRIQMSKIAKIVAYILFFFSASTFLLNI